MCAISLWASSGVADLYAGIGNLTLPLAEGGRPVLAVEMEGQATHDLRARAPAHVHVQTGRVERFDLSRHPFDLAVLDPPRAGAGEVMQRVLHNRPRRIVLVSCHLPSARRDVAVARKGGYRVGSVRCFDLFPDTHHVETVIALER